MIPPYRQAEKVFDNESEAYHYFSNQVGLENYVEDVLVAVKSLTKKTRLIGFSMGASVVWRLSALALPEVTSGVAFYGSQIRHSTDIEPSFPLTLVFPKSEEHFSVDDLMGKLKSKSNVEVFSTPYRHGFMNKLSTGFDVQGYSHYLNALNDWT